MIVNGRYEAAAEKWLRSYPREFRYRPHSVLQAESHFSDADVFSSICGRRWGKTTLAVGKAMMLIEEAARTPFITESGQDITHTLHPGVHVWVLAPQNDLVRQVIEEFQAMVPSRMIVRDRSGNTPGELGDEVRAVIGEDRRMTMRLRLYDVNMRIARGIVRPDVTIQFKSAESRISMQSGGLDVLLVTEAQDVPERMYTQALPALSSPGRMGKLIVEGISPESSENWFARLARRCIADRTGDYDILIAETADNPLLSSKELWRIWRQRGSSMTTAEWDRVYRAVLPTSGGGFFRYVNECAVPHSELAGPVPGRRYVGGLDTGRLSDATVLTIKDAATRHSVSRLVFENQEPWEYQMTMFEQVKAIWNLQQINFDATSMGGDLLMTMLQSRHLPVVPVVFTTGEKDRLYSEYAVSMEQNTTSYPAEWIDLQEQLSAIRVKGRRADHRARIFSSEGNIKDDHVDSEVLAHRACDPPIMNLKPAADPTITSLVPHPVVGRKNRRNRRPDMFDEFMTNYKRIALQAQRDALEDQEDQWEELLR